VRRVIIVMAIVLAGCEVPFEAAPPDPWHGVPHAEYPRPAVTVAAQSWSDEGVGHLALCTKDTDCSYLGCPHECERWVCLGSVCSIVDRAGDPCITPKPELGYCHGNECWGVCGRGDGCSNCVCPQATVCNGVTCVAQ
jgi:hypothetical protein